MKKASYAILLLFLVAVLAWFGRKHIYRLVATSRPDRPMPHFVLQTLDGGKLNSRQLAGKILVLDFWATWCKPCLRALPVFAELTELYRDEHDVVFLAINTSRGGDTLGQVRRFVADKAYPFNVVYDRGALLSDQLEIDIYPTIVVVDRSGRQCYRHFGYTPAMEDLRQSLQREIDGLLQASSAEGEGPRLRPRLAASYRP